MAEFLRKGYREICHARDVGRFWLQIQSYELETRNIENGTAR